VAILELIRIENFVHIPEYWHGQSSKNRKQITRSPLMPLLWHGLTNKEIALIKKDAFQSDKK